MAQTRRVVTITGARPQFIKAFALSRALAAAPDFEEILVHTGQHFDDNMSAVFFDELGLQQPKYHLSVDGTGHGATTAQMLANLEAVLFAEKPDAAIVYGDTNSTLAGALAAAKLCIPVIHVEAGMRSFNRSMPEEINRIVADHLSEMLLCVTHTAVTNLAAEGIRKGVHLVGDLMYDATLFATAIAEKQSHILDRLTLTPKGYGVATVHRASNTDDPAALAAVLDFIAKEAARQPVVFPVHPRTAKAAANAGLDLGSTGALIVEPVGYLDMCQLLHHAAIVLTDSGGVQKEAYFHRVPCITLRDETEWVETVQCGWNRLWTEPDYKPRREIEDFGDGHSAKRIVECLRSNIGGERPVRSRGAVA
jgi:UDP-GlcNAc3NAcA epimerase